MLSICSILSSEKHWPQNFVHGQSLQILHLIRVHKIPSQIVKVIFDCLHKVQQRTLSAAVLTTIFDIYNENLNNFESIDFDFDLEQIKCDYRKEQSFYYAVFQKSLLVFNLHKFRLQGKTVEITDALCSFENSSYEEIETKLNVMLSLGSETLDEEFGIRKDEKEISQRLSTGNRVQLGSEEMLGRVIHTKVFYPECTMKAYAIYSNLQCELKFSLEEMIDLSSNEIGYSKIPLAMCVERITRTHKSFESFKMSLIYLKDITQPWNPDTLRLKASSILGNLGSNLPIALGNEDLQASVDTLVIFFNLLQDDDLYVRRNTSEVVLKCIGATELCGKC